MPRGWCDTTDSRMAHMGRAPLVSWEPEASGYMTVVRPGMTSRMCSFGRMLKSTRRVLMSLKERKRMTGRMVTMLR
jgi:hypothetical protein